MLTQHDIESLGETIHDPYEALANFMSAFGASLDPRLWLKLVDEELTELYAEVPNTQEHLKELSDLLYVYTGLDLLSHDYLGELMPEDERNKAIKLLGRAERALTEYADYYSEAKLARAFSRVHESNMSKLGADGKPIKRDDGKVMKGPNYEAPDLSDLVQKKKEIH